MTKRRASEMETIIENSFKQGAKLAANADLGAVAQERGIEFFLVAFVDIKGVLRTKMVPAEQIGFVQKNGAGFAPFAAWFDYGPDAPDLIVIPDASTLLQVPFQPELGFLTGDCFINDQLVKQAPRQVLKDVVAKAAERGYVFKTGCEAEFFLLAADGEPAISDPKDVQSKPCYDAQALMRRYAVLKDIIKTLNRSGFGVYQNDHEDANGQFEINWHYSDCLHFADQVVYFKWVVKTLAERHGYRATFMPRPFKNLAGNGLHSHCSLWKGETNVFKGDGKNSTVMKVDESMALSDAAWHFLGGVLEKAPAFCAISNPSVNSFKRLNGAATLSGATWSPNRVSWSGNNRSHMVRVPENDRFEVRLADGAANPYLLPAVLLAVGLWGMDQKSSPKSCYFPPNVNMYAIPDGAKEVAHITTLPLNLLDALRALEADKDLANLLGTEFVNAFLKLKKAEWKDYISHLSSWELENTLDC